MVFIPLSVFAPVPNFHSEFKLQGLAQTRKTELKPFLANLGTHLRAIKGFSTKVYPFGLLISNKQI
jgi:hypothetical protein